MVYVFFYFALLVNLLADERYRLLRTVRETTIAHRALVVERNLATLHMDIFHRADRGAQTASNALASVRLYTVIILFSFTVEVQPLSEQPRNVIEKAQALFRVFTALDFIGGFNDFLVRLFNQLTVFVERLFQKFDVAYTIGHFQMQTADNLCSVLLKQPCRTTRAVAAE